ncbi:TPA: hypothetical protein ACUI23_002245 [Staphylococcus pseudintermedius]
MHAHPFNNRVDIIAHRGFVKKGVENSRESLKAAGDIISLLGYPNHYSAFSLFSSQIEIFDVNISQYFGYTESGHSGSGLFNLQGELVGIHIGKDGSYNLPLGKFFNPPLGSVYSVDNTLTTIGNDLKKRAELQAQ